jgi:hypothetical protein
MSQRSVHERLKSVESQLAVLQAQFETSSSRANKDWRRAVEKYVGDPDLLAILQGAQRLRESDRRKARKSSDKRRRK